jgi:hypothetical protein
MPRKSSSVETIARRQDARRQQMARFKVGDKVRVMARPENWPACTDFTLLGAEGTVSLWVDWPEAMDPYSEFVYVKVEKAPSEGKVNEGAYMVFHKDTLEKI